MGTIKIRQIIVNVRNVKKDVINVMMEILVFNVIKKEIGF